MSQYNVSNEIINEVVSNFKGVEHRLEYVDTVNGVEYYNDTEATNIKCTQIALSSFNRPIIIFLGGLERGQDFNELTPYMDNVKTVIAIGECRNRVEEYAKSISVEFMETSALKKINVKEAFTTVVHDFLLKSETNNEKKGWLSCPCF